MSINFTTQRLAGVALAASLLAAPLTWADLSSYSQDFEGLNQADGGALGADGWLVGANVFAPDGTTFLYNYFASPAPNGGPAFSAIDAGQGGPAQGAQQLSIYNDYNNTDHNIGNRIEAIVFQEQTIGAADVGQVYKFRFDAKLGNLVPASTATAFVKTLNPNAGFSVTNLVEKVTTNLPADWGTFELSLFIDASLVGQILQFGFNSTAANFDPSGVFYDNLSFEPVSLAPYAQDFEGLDMADPDALANDGWKVFGNVFAPDGVAYLYGYGTFPAPNGSGGFSNVGAGEGGPDQGAQQLVIFNDYNNTDHNIGNVIESNVFQEQIISAADAGQTYVFSFDAKLGDLVAPTAALAYIKTLDPSAGFATTNLVTLDAAALPPVWGSYSLSLTIDASLAGQLLQIGFNSTTANFTASGVVYDNIAFGPLVDPDSDSDGVADSIDNCTLVANSDQRDSNGDGFGNRCDADLNGDCIVNPVDLGIFRSRFFTADADADFNGDGVVNTQDLGILRSLFFAPPGPNSTGTCP